MYSFGPFTLNVERYELLKSGTPITLPKTPMEVLIMLVERDGGLVSRQELAECLWASSDSEAVKQSINNAINRIRYALLDNAEAPLYIQTVVGKGYRFVCSVEILEAEGHTGPQDGRIDPVLDRQLPSAAVEISSSDVPGATLSGDLQPQTPALKDQGASFAVPGGGSARDLQDDAVLPSRTRWTTALLVAALVLLCLAAGAGLLKHRTSTMFGDQQARSFQLTRLTSNVSTEWVSASAISPNGEIIVSAEPTQLRFYSANGAEISRTTTPNLRVIDRIAWFSDNFQLLVSGLNRSSGVPEVWLYSSAGSAPVKMRSDARMAVPSPSGAQIAFTNASGSEIWVMDSGGQRPRRLVASSTATTYEALIWTATGHTLLAQRLQRGSRFASNPWDPMHGVKPSYVAADLSSGELRTVVDGVWMEDAAWLPTGDLLYTQPDEKGGLGLWIAPIDAETGAFRSPPHLLQAVPQLRALTSARNGTVAAISIGIRPQIAVGDLRKLPLRLENVRPILTAGSRAYPHAWSPDSTLLYFEQQLNDRWSIFSNSLASGLSASLASSPLDQTIPRVTPDHRWILFQGRERGMQPSQLFRLPLEGGTPQLVPTDGPVSDFRCPSQAGRCLLRKLEDLKQLVFIPIDPIHGAGSPVLKVPWDASNDLEDWDISADGNRLVLTPSQKFDPQLQVIDIPTGHSEQVAVDVHRPIKAVNWTADARGWYLALANGHGSDLVYVSPGQPPILLRQTTGQTYAVPSPDGHRLAFVDQNIDSNIWLLRSTGSSVSEDERRTPLSISNTFRRGR